MKIVRPKVRRKLYSADRPAQTDRERRDEERGPERDAGLLEEEIRGERPEHVERAVSEIHDAHDPEDDRETEREQRVEGAVHETVEEKDGEVAEVHEAGPARLTARRATTTYFGILQPASASGREAVSAGIVARTLE